MKKITTLLLALSLIAGMSFPTYADEVESVSLDMGEESTYTYTQEAETQEMESSSYTGNAERENETPKQPVADETSNTKDESVSVGGNDEKFVHKTQDDKDVKDVVKNNTDVEEKVYVHKTKDNTPEKPDEPIHAKPKEPVVPENSITPSKPTTPPTKPTTPPPTEPIQPPVTPPAQKPPAVPVEPQTSVNKTKPITVKTTTGNVVVNAEVLQKESDEVVQMINEERVKAGLKPLTVDVNMMDASILRASETSVMWSHTRPDGTKCFTAHEGINGENIAKGYLTSDSVMKGWMNSQGHRENILRPNFTRVSVACVKTENGYFWVQLFGI